MQRQRSVLYTLILLLLPSINLSAQNQPPSYLKEYQNKGLPPIGQTVEFENKEAFPPQLKGQKPSEKKLEYQTVPATRTLEAFAAVREAAVADAQVQKVLGKRFRYLGSDSGERTAEKSVAPSDASTVIRFYSYTRNRVVDVHLRDDKVVAVRLGPPGFQPAESREEVAEAADIVRADKRYSALVADLPARGLVTPSNNGHRYLYLLFYKEEDVPPPVFRATVDMTARRVVSTRVLTQSHK